MTFLKLCDWLNSSVEIKFTQKFLYRIGVLVNYERKKRICRKNDSISEKRIVTTQRRRRRRLKRRTERQTAARRSSVTVVVFDVNVDVDVDVVGEYIKKIWTQKMEKTTKERKKCRGKTERIDSNSINLKQVQILSYEMMTLLGQSILIWPIFT